MSDRLVRVIYPKSKINEQPQLFSSYFSYPNIVLLGDPGAGKSHLFQYSSNHEGAEKLVARSFLNKPEYLFSNASKIYIDALDEIRAGRGGVDIVDEIVRKLFKTKPERVRISCRAADWLGEADLSVFKDYFETTGESIVLHLLPLDEAEWTSPVSIDIS